MEPVDAVATGLSNRFGRLKPRSSRPQKNGRLGAVLTSSKTWGRPGGRAALFSLCLDPLVDLAPGDYDSGRKALIAWAIRMPMLTNMKVPAIIDPMLFLDLLSAYALKTNREYEVCCERSDAVSRQRPGGHIWNGSAR
jgi:hypothetical protein